MSEQANIELQPEDITQGFFIKDGIGSEAFHAANHSNKQQLSSSSQEGEIFEY